MFGIKIVSEKEYNGLKTEIKGYYDSVNEVNEYLRAIDAQMKGAKLPSFQTMGREQIKQAYETSAAVMGVVNYIAENVGEVARYLELQNAKASMWRRTGCWTCCVILTTASTSEGLRQRGR